MNAIAPTEFNPSLAVINGAIKTTSLKVAEHFGKRHTHVLRAIQNLECSAEFHAPNFGLVEYSDAKGEKRPAYEMTKDGFTFLAMGFTGKEAAKWKEAYINAFNKMAEQLSSNPLQLEPKTKKALPNGLTLEQQDCIKALVRQRVAELPKDKQAKAAITCWSSIKSKYGKTYKAVEPEHFTNIVSLLGRLPLEGELVEKDSDEFLSSHQYRDEARRSLNAHLDACHADMAQAGVKAPEWPTMDEKTITGLASGLLWQSRWLMSFNPDTMKPQLQPIPMNVQALSFEQWIDHAKNRGYVVIKRDELLHKLEASH